VLVAPVDGNIVDAAVGPVVEFEEVAAFPLGKTLATGPGVIWRV
jgi:hypothetical protein